MSSVKLPAHVYHLAEASNRTSIRRHGLLTASRLLGVCLVGTTPADWCATLNGRAVFGAP